MIHRDVLSTVGETPVVQLNRLAPEGSEIMVKLESGNPAGSIKDRPALSIVEEAELTGRLRPGGTIVESTSGNFGKSLAMIGAVRGYRVVIVVDPKTSPSVANFCRACGARLEMVDTPDELGGYQKPRVERVRELLEEIPGAFWPDQYNNEANPRAHEDSTAAEIAREVGEIDVLVATVSTGGHTSGLARALKRIYPRMTAVAVDAHGSSIFGTPYHPYLIRGIGLSWQPDNADPRAVDWLHQVSDIEAFTTCRSLARHEGMFVGESAGAAAFAAASRAMYEGDRRILVMAADSGVNYVTESYDDEWVRERTGRKIEADPTPEDFLARAYEPENRPLAVGESVARHSKRG